MCDFQKFFTRLFTPSGTGAKEAAAEASLDEARKNSNVALQAQQQSIDQAKAAADSASETNRLASESRMRKLLSAGAFGAVAPSLGAAPIGTRQLFGA